MSNEKLTRIVSDPSNLTDDGDQDAKTRLIKRDEADEPEATYTVAESSKETPKTRFMSAGSSTEDGSKKHAADNENGPVVGWLVVVEGPGRGNACEIHYGMNSIGRGEGEKIRLDFGDDTVSREAHAFIVFDDKQQDFYVQHGGKSNLVRLNDLPVMSPMAMKRGDRIDVGATRLMFVPLCDADFNWNQASSE